MRRLASWCAFLSVLAPWALGCASSVATDAGDVSHSDACGTPGDRIATPRLIAPPSGVRITSRSYPLRWTIGGENDGARIEVCADRACTRVLWASNVSGDSVWPPDLPPGVVYWRATGRACGQQAVSPGPTWEFFVPHASRPRSSRWSCVPDLDGDGLADVVVWEPRTRLLHIHYGHALGILAGEHRTLRASPDQPDRELRCAGDLNGDGLSEIAVTNSTARMRSPEGRLQILTGSAQRDTRLITVPVPPPAEAPMLRYFEASGNGDFNGDGFGDLLAFVYFDGPDPLNPPEPETPRLWLYHGQSDVPTSRYRGISNPQTVDRGFGFRATGLGDIDGDGNDDLATPAGYGGVEPGVDYCRLGASDASTRLVVLREPDSVPREDHNFGRIMTGIGDSTGDGLPDVSAPSQYGADGAFLPRLVHVFSYRDTGEVRAATTLTAGIEGDGGGPIHAVGDVNADGWPELLVETRRPGLSLYLGAAGGFAMTPIVLQRAGAPLDSTGRWANGTGDINGDGYDDVVIPWPYASEIDVYYGGADGITMARHEVLRGANPMSQYGAGLAW